MANTETNRVRNLQRWWEVQSIFLRYGFDVLVDKANLGRARRWARATREGQAAVPDLERLSMPIRMRLMLEELGPTFVKLGQVASSQSHSIPPDWLIELEKLQSSVPPFPESQVRATIVQEFGSDPEYLFRDFDFTPLAAASIGQVHAAVSEDYRKVVVKVQRPGVVPQIESDLAIMREVARRVEATSNLARNYGAVAIVDEFAASITRELDYRNEARNLDRLREVLAPVHGVRTPRVCWDRVTSKVLTMEHVEGVRITDLSLLGPRVDRIKVADTFVQAMVRQILIEGFFHADVHPGNVFAMSRTGEIVFIDVGMTGSLDARQRGQLVDLMRGLAQRDARRLTNVVLDLGVTFKPVDEAALERDIGSLIRRHLSGSLVDFSYARFLSELLSILFDNGVRTPSDLLFALKAIMQTEHIVRTLNPAFSITDLANTAGSLVLAHQLRPSALRATIASSLDQIVRVAPMLGDAVELYVRDARRDKQFTRLDPGDMQRFGQIVMSTANRFVLAVLLVGTMLSSVLVMALPTNPSRPILPVLGAMGFGVSVALAVLMVLHLMWSMWRK